MNPCPHPSIGVARHLSGSGTRAGADHESPFTPPVDNSKPAPHCLTIHVTLACPLPHP